MDELDKIRLKSAALLRARNYLLNQSPSDPVAIAQVTENIVDLAGRQLVGIHVTKIPKVSADEQRKLKNIIGNLEQSIEKEAPAVDIIAHSKGIFDLVPWPPKGVKIDVPAGLAPWPPKGLKDWPPE